VDGKKVHKLAPLQRRGRFTLREFLPGEHEILFETVAKHAKFYLNHEPLGPSKPPIFRERVLYSIRQGQPLLLPVEKRQGEETLVNIILYLDSGINADKVTLNGSLVTQIPAFRTDCVTLDYTKKNIRYYLGPTQVTPCIERIDFRELGMRRYVMYFPLRNDLRTAMHRIRFHLNGTPQARIRFLALKEAPATAERIRFRALMED
jgi:hypothetical protein